MKRLINIMKKIKRKMGIGDWGLGIGPNPQTINLKNEKNN